MSEERILVRIEQPTVLEIEIEPERLGLLRAALDLLNKGLRDNESQADLSAAEIVRMLVLPSEEYLDGRSFSVTRGYLAPFTLHAASRD